MFVHHVPCSEPPTESSSAQLYFTYKFLAKPSSTKVQRHKFNYIFAVSDGVPEHPSILIFTMHKVYQEVARMIYYFKKN